MSLISPDSTPAAELVAALERSGARFWKEGERLRFEAPRHVIDDRHRKSLAAHKEQILNLLASREQRDLVPLTGMQEAYWVGEKGGLSLSTPARYYFELALRPVPFEVVSRAMAVLCASHQLLRAAVDASGRIRIESSAAPLAIPVHQVASDAAGALRDEIQARMLAERATTGARPPLQLVVSMDPGETRLHFDISLWAFDALALRTFLGDLLHLLSGSTAELPGPRREYRAEAARQSSRRDRQEKKTAWSYWAARLDDFPTGPSLPRASAVAIGSSGEWTRHSATLEPSVARQLAAKAAAAGVTSAFAVCTAYGEVLARFAGARHFALTVLYSDRTVEYETKGASVGNFGRTLLLEVDFREAASFAFRARALQSQFWSDLRHASVTGIEVSRELLRRRGATGDAAFPVTFTVVPPLLPAPTDHPLHAVLDHSRARLEVPQVHLDHQVCEGPSGELTLNWDHVREVLPSALVDRMFAAFMARLRTLAEDDGAWSSAAAPRLCFTVPTPAVVPPRLDGRLHAGFLEQARAKPDRVAVITPSATLTYGELLGCAASLAERLGSSGVRRGDLVAVVMEKGWEQVVAVLGILLCGAAYVPIDPGLPPARRRLLFLQTAAAAAVTTPGLDSTLEWPESVQRVLVASTGEKRELRGSSFAQEPHDLAYVIFTSGTSGNPKGVMIEHAAAVNTIADINERIGIGPRDRVFGISSLSFDLSVYDIFGPLSAGAAVVLPDAAKSRVPSHWRDLVEQQEVTIWNSVPALVQVLDEAIRSCGHGSTSLRTILMSGDWIPVKLPGQLRELSPSLRLISLGGATEASIWSNIHEISEVPPEWVSIPYGRALTHQSMHVLDDALDVCAPLVPGNIYIGGVGLARGYLADPERTTTAFIDHPVTGERLYRTGDRGRYRADGEIELLGREDQQVKIQGYRVECSEIEAALLEEEMSAAVVTAFTDPRGTKRLVAYVVPRPEDARRDPADVKARLAQRLPGYMVPATIVWMEALPLTSNGKVDRAKLPSPSFTIGTASPQPRAPRDETEERMLALWREALGAPMGIHDDFFDHGGTSLTGLILMTRIERTFGRRIGLGELMQRPTVARIAELLRDATAPVNESPVLALRSGGASPPVVCVHPVGGNVFCYRDLASRMPSARQVLGVRAPALIGGPTYADVPEMAHAYLQALADRGVTAPRALVGWSMGGLVCYEMARQLQERGVQVPVLALIDSTYPQRSDVPRQPSEADLVVRFLRDVLAIAGRPAKLDLGDLEARGPGSPAQQAFGLLAARGVQFFTTPAELWAQFELFRSHLRALDAYQPAPYDGAVTLFCARDKSLVDEQRRWWEVARRANAMTLDADHYSIITGQALEQIASTISAEVCAVRDGT